MPQQGVTNEHTDHEGQPRGTNQPFQGVSVRHMAHLIGHQSGHLLRRLRRLDQAVENHDVATRCSKCIDDFPVVDRDLEPVGGFHFFREAAHQQLQRGPPCWIVAGASLPGEGIGYLLAKHPFPFHGNHARQGFIQIRDPKEHPSCDQNRDHPPQRHPLNSTAARKVTPFQPRQAQRQRVKYGAGGDGKGCIRFLRVYKTERLTAVDLFAEPYPLERPAINGSTVPIQYLQSPACEHNPYRLALCSGAIH